MDILVDLVGAVTLVVTVASIIAAVTPKPKDDAWIGKRDKLIDALALNSGKAKDR